MPTSLLIQLEDRSRSEWPLLQGERPCYVTVTSVRLLDAHTIVCCSLQARKIYLIRFDLGFCHYTVIDSADTVYGGSPTEIWRCDIDGRGNVVTSNGAEDGTGSDGGCGNLSLYRVVGDKICHDRDLFTDLVRNACHGIRFCGSSGVVAATSSAPRGLHFFDVQTMRKQLYVATDRFPQDVCFLPGRRAILAVTDEVTLPMRLPTRFPGSVPDRAPELQLLEYDLAEHTGRVIDSQPCAARQLDSVAHYEGRLYVVDSLGGRVLVVDARTLRQVDQINGYDLPYGVDARHGILAVACFGTNAIHVRPIRPLW